MVLRLWVSVSAAALALGGCSGDNTPAPAASTDAAAVATAQGPDAKPGLSASAGRLVLPAVPGRPGAAYFTIANGDAAPATIAAVYVDGAGKAEMHETKGGAMAALKTVDVPAGGALEFVPGGRHVMVFDIPETVKAGGTVEMTLTFADGDKLSAPLTVEAAGGMGDMTGMDHSGHGEAN